MRVALLAVVENGDRRSPEVPANTRQTLQAARGSDLLVRATVVTPGGIRVDLGAAGTSLVLTVKRKTSDGSATLSKTGSVQPLVGKGVADFSFVAADFKNLTPGRYVFDVVLVQTSARQAVVPASPFVLQAGVTPAP